eukprot:NODE_151_length_17042_cov_0.275925.p8 type:complete len:139 gc:universal NODE_151_length_17042_cov_0.275925:14494-14078(-)
MVEIKQPIVVEPVPDPKIAKPKYNMTKPRKCDAIVCFFILQIAVECLVSVLYPPGWESFCFDFILFVSYLKNKECKTLFVAQLFLGAINVVLWLFLWVVYDSAPLILFIWKCIVYVPISYLWYKIMKAHREIKKKPEF